MRCQIITNEKYILTLFAILFTLIPSQAVKKFEANPINIAVMLTQETDTASMAFTCDDYGYVRQIPSDGYTVFKHANGSIIRYKYIDSEQKYPTIELISKATQKEKDNSLQSLHFKKIGNTYEHQSIGYTTKCTSGSHGSLILTRYPKPKL